MSKDNADRATGASFDRTVSAHLDHARSQIQICPTSGFIGGSLLHKCRLTVLLQNTRYLPLDAELRTHPTSSQYNPKEHSLTNAPIVKMISFASFPSTSEGSGSYTSTRYHPKIEEDEVGMDLDEDDFEEGTQRLTVPGESITSSHAFMRYVPMTLCSSLCEAHFWQRGHGTFVDDEEVIASVAGTVERVNKLITVRAVRSRYTWRLCPFRRI